MVKSFWTVLLCTDNELETHDSYLHFHLFLSTPATSIKIAGLSWGMKRTTTSQSTRWWSPAWSPSGVASTPVSPTTPPRQTTLPRPWPWMCTVSQTWEGSSFTRSLYFSMWSCILVVNNTNNAKHMQKTNHHQANVTQPGCDCIILFPHCLLFLFCGEQNSIKWSPILTNPTTFHSARNGYRIFSCGHNFPPSREPDRHVFR